MGEGGGGKVAGRDSRREVVAALAAALEARDRPTGGHSARVAALAVRVGKAMGLGEEELLTLYSAAWLHDVGKIGISDDLLHKPGGLSEEELGRMRLHSVIGMRILERVEGLQEAALLIRHHHERLDGAGYPDGLAGESIPLGSRIIAVCEVFDILTSGVPWRAVLEPEAAVAELCRCAGTQFDPGVVAVLAAFYGLEGEWGGGA